jgi:hypothetical protein
MKNKFAAKIEIIGVNPFVFLPDKILKAIFKEAGKEKGKIPVKMKIDGHPFTQTLIKYSGEWRLYLNTPMRKAAKKEVGDVADFEIKFNSVKKVLKPHPKLALALSKNKNAKKVFDSLAPSRRLEIIRYISFLKTEESVDRNVKKAISYLENKGSFVGMKKI